ncbi:MAG: hypothetical protein L0H54_05470, partial [Alcaligenaceae bacterium]|nr:hypothetical protein [Alcaligenaceae bacterium]
LHLRYPFPLGRGEDDLDLYYQKELTNESDDSRTYTITKDVILESTPSAPQPRRYWGPGDLEYDASTTNTIMRRDRRVDAVRVDSEQNAGTAFTITSAANPENCITSRKTLFLNDDQDTVDGAIDDMEAKGSTLIPSGLLWAWRMLDPAWQGAWDGSSKPQPTNPKALRKVIVLLTDGENAPGGSRGPASGETRSAFQLEYDVQRVTTQQTCTVNWWGNESCNAETSQTPVAGSEQLKTYITTDRSASVSKQGPMTSLRMRDPSNQSDTNSSIGWGTGNSLNRSAADSYLTALCENVRNDGNAIKIYTVTLGKLDGDTEAMMNACSSGAGYYYNTRNSDDLPKVFQSIASAMIELRLTK